MDTTVVFKEAHVLVARTCFFADIFHNRGIFKKWFEDMLEADRKNEYPHSSTKFIPWLGSFSYTGGLPYIYLEKYQSGLFYRPYYLPINKSITLTEKTGDWKIHVKPSLRFLQCGGCTVTLSIKVFSKTGLAHDELIGFLRKLNADGNSSPRIFKMQGQDKPLNIDEVFNKVLYYFKKGIIKEYTDIDKLKVITGEPDLFVINILDANPIPSHTDANRKLMTGLIKLNLNYTKLKPEKFDEKGIYENDWYYVNKRGMLFLRVNDGKVNNRKIFEKGKHWRIGWSYFNMIEFARMEKFSLDYMTGVFENVSLQITKSNNRPKEFVKNLIKLSFYNDTFVTYRYDLPLLSEKIYGTKAGIYDMAAEALETEKAWERFDNAYNDFIEKVEEWKPKAMSVVDFVKECMSFIPSGGGK